jgi:hypothetical protein
MPMTRFTRGRMPSSMAPGSTKRRGKIPIWDRKYRNILVI